MLCVVSECLPAVMGHWYPSPYGEPKNVFDQVQGIGLRRSVCRMCFLITIKASQIYTGSLNYSYTNSLKRT